MISPILKAVDGTCTFSIGKIIQARNAPAYCEISRCPSRISGIRCSNHPKPLPVDEPEWLLQETHVARVVVGLDASPARIVAPDSRWFAL